MKERPPSLYRKTLQPPPRRRRFGVLGLKVLPYRHPALDTPLLTTRDKLHASLDGSIIIRPGREGSLRMHPDIPGAEFSEAECADAADAALSAQKCMALPMFPPDRVSGLPLTQALLSDRGFWGPAKTSDARSMMSAALKQKLVLMRLDGLSAGELPSDARKQAAGDVMEALAMAERSGASKRQPSTDKPEDIATMHGLARRYPDASDYLLAMKALDILRQGARPTDLPADVSGVVVTDERIRNRSMLESLNGFEKSMMAKAIGARELDADNLSDFISLHPGKRDLLLRREVNRQWLSESWKERLELYRDIYLSVYKKCGLTEPTDKEMLEAAMEPSNLSEEQMTAVSNLVSGESFEDVSGGHMTALMIWLRADKDELRKAWALMYPDHEKIDGLMESFNTQGVSGPHAGLLAGILKKQTYELSIEDITDRKNLERALAPMNEFKRLWVSTPKEERMEIWRYGSSDLFSAASLSHKLRYGGRRVRFTRDEDRIAAEIFPGLGGMDYMDLSAREVAADMFRSYSAVAGGGREYERPVYHLAKRPGMDVSSLRAAAYREAEFRTLAEFLGTYRPAPQTQIVDGMWSSVAKKPEGGMPERNEDSCSSVEIIAGEGSVMRLDMVADGMGGHKKGWSEWSETNGQIASRTAKEVFEICAMAGWINSPEDARRTIMLADMAILKEQINHKERDDLAVENDMGCTMTIVLQQDDKLWGVHAGDSGWKVIRDGNAAFSGIGHTSEWGYLQKLRKLAYLEVRQRFYDLGYDPDALDDGVRDAFQENADEETHIRYAKAIDEGKVRFGGVSSALGHAAAYIHINNADAGYEPFQLRKDDMVVLCSDGVGVPICNHEFSISAERSGWNLTAAREMLVEQAASRVGKHERVTLDHLTLCECGVRTGKPRSDDATLMMRYATGALKPLEAEPPAQPNGFRPAEGLAVPSLPEEHPSHAPSEIRPEKAGTEEVSAGIPTDASLKSLDEEMQGPAPREKSGPLEMSARGPKRGRPLEKTHERPDIYPPIFHSQTTEQGEMLPDDATRYLDRVVRDLQGSEVVQDVARELRMLPRDLEVMVFHAYCGDLALATDPHQSPGGWELVGMVPGHLSSGDAERILRASHLIYMLKESQLAPSDKQKIFAELKGHLSAISIPECAARLQMTAFSCHGSKDDEGGMPAGRKRRKKA